MPSRQFFIRLANMFAGPLGIILSTYLMAFWLGVPDWPAPHRRYVFSGSGVHDNDTTKVTHFGIVLTKQEPPVFTTNSNEVLTFILPADAKTLTIDLTKHPLELRISPK